ncbi:MAG: S41 family peptidase [bacterium]|nr:S41 family peptidase [bacterium]
MKKIRYIAVIFSLMLLSAGAGYQLAKREIKVEWEKTKPQVTITDRDSERENEVSFKIFWDVWDLLSRSYVGKESLDPQKMVYGAVAGMTQSLGDPYTVFLPPGETKDFKNEMAGTPFEGIGAQLGFDKQKRLAVVAPLQGMPAEKAGIKAGDLILKIDGKETLGMSLPDAVSKIRGPKGTKVTLTLFNEKEEKPREITVSREPIKIKSVELSFKEATKSGGFVAYLKLSRFGDETPKEWEEAVGELKAQGPRLKDTKGMVLDLRNNPGGYLQGAVFIAGEFLPIKTSVVFQESADGNRQTFSVDRQGRLLDLPLVVIINKGSASASEIVAGALADHGRAKVVGEQSFGKGSIQEVKEIPDGSSVHVTTAKWLTPKGAWINSTGIAPDVKIEMDGGSVPDIQLEKAIEELIKK